MTCLLNYGNRYDSNVMSQISKSTKFMIFDPVNTIDSKELRSCLLFEYSSVLLTNSPLEVLGILP
jgi:hypothetical protein